MAAMAALQFNGVSVYVPPQQCCGMPTLLEGDKTKTLRRLRFNMDILLELAESGFDPVFSCPTCCYVMKVFLKEGAYYSEAYQRIAGAGTDEMRIPRNQADGDEFVCLQKTIYKNILKDNGCFSSLDSLKRIALADSVAIIGDYLDRKLKTDRLNNSFAPVPGRFASFTSCHQREQGASVHIRVCWTLSRVYPQSMREIPSTDVEWEETWVSRRTSMKHQSGSESPCFIK